MTAHPPSELGRPFELDLPVRSGVPAVRRVVRGRVDGLRPDAAPQPFVLCVHGYLTFMDWGFLPALSEALVARGFAVVRFNLSGSGVGPELDDFTDPVGFAHNTYEQELEDVAAVRAAVDAGELGALDADRAGIWGHSRGSAIAVLHAARQATAGGAPYRALVTWASCARVGRYDPGRLEEWRRNGFLWVQLADGRRLRLERDLLDDFEGRPARLDVLGAARRIEAPTLLVHGARDRNVERAEAEELAAALAGDTRIRDVERAGHNFGARHPLREVRPQLAEALTVTVGHFERYLAPGGR